MPIVFESDSDNIKEHPNWINTSILREAGDEFLRRHPELTDRTIFVFVRIYVEENDDNLKNMNTPDKVDIRTVGSMMNSSQVAELMNLEATLGGPFSIVKLFVTANSPVLYSKLISSFWHELRHVLQHHTGRLAYKDDMIVWDGTPWFTWDDVKSCYETYHDSPWEQDARIANTEAITWYRRKQFWDGFTRGFNIFRVMIQMIKGKQQ